MQTYQRMKNSGVEWLGNIPADWRQKPAKYLFKQVKESVGDDPSEYELLSLTLRGIIPRSEVEGGKNPDNYSAYQVVNSGDLIMCLFDYDVTPRTVGRATTTGMVTGAYTNLRPSKGVSTRYYNYFFLALDNTKELLHLCTGLRNGLSKTTFFALNLPFPDYETQERIANYLDEETAKIDFLIAKQKRLLGLLEEKRRAALTHSVVLGIDSSVDFKETSAHWLGKVPEHWNILKMGYAYRRKSDKNHPDEELLSVYRDYGVIPKSSRDDNHNVESADLTNYQMVEPNDLVTNKMKTWQGSIAISTVQGIVSPAYFTFKPIVTGMLPQFMHYQLRSDRHVAFYKSISKGIRPGQWDLDIDQFKMMPLVLPPVEEQKRIVNHIQENEKKTKAIKEHVDKEIALLVERRSALISNVVTGKVKV